MKKIFTTTLLILAGFISVFASGHIVSITSTTNVACFGMCDGSATALASGGIGPYAYAWTGPLGYTSANATATGMCAGTYTVTAIDSSDMSIATVNVTITQPTQMWLSLHSCGNFNIIEAYVYNGSSPYTYSWDAATGNQTTQTATGLSPGTYSVTVYDSYGCTITGTHTLTNIPPFTGTITNTPNTCNCNGSINLSINGTNPPFTYVWSNGMSYGNSINNLCPGSYNVTISDSNGCTDTYSSTIADSSGGVSINVVLDSIININCANNNSLGSIYVHGTGGLAPYTYIWSHGAITSGITNLGIGNYTVTVIDSHGCSNFSTYSIQNTYNLYSSAYITNANCTNNGMATLIPSGVNPPFTFLWNDSLSQTSATATNLSPGAYQVTITDANGCTISPYVYVSNSCFNVIKGRVYVDYNHNCIQDVGEPGIPNMIVISNNNFFGSTNSNGDYIIHTYSMNNIVALSNYQTNGYTLICPSSGTLNINLTTLGDSSLVNNFGVIPAYPDFRIFPAWTGANPGFNKTYKLYGSNISPVTQSAILRLTYDSVLQYIGSNLGGVHNIGLHTVEWNANNISPWSYWNPGAIPQATFYVPTSVSITDTLHTCVEILPIVGDVNPWDNTRCFDEQVTGSFDPNSKDVLPRGLGTQGFITTNDSVLFYTIHFQNTGNDTCFTVEIKDTLSQYLEPASIIPGASSHPYTFTLSEHGILTFRFDQILLPDSNINVSGSNGYVNYTVNLKQSLPIGTEIKNTASIFFDFNAPVITNTTLNTIASTLQIKEVESKAIISACPNPFKDYTTIKIKTDETNVNYSFELIDIIGNDVMKINNIKTKEFNITNSKLVEGIYFYIVKTNDKIIGSGKLIKN